MSDPEIVPNLIADEQLEIAAPGSRVGYGQAYPHIAARVFDTPLLIDQGKLKAILHALGPRLGFDVAQEFDAEASARVADEITAARYESMLAPLGVSQRVERRDEGYYVVGDVAIVPVIGTLLHRSSWMDAMSGMTSYAKVERMFGAAQNDYTVRSIIAEYDTAGGEVAGAYDSVDRLYGMRGNKQVVAVVSEMALSGGYLLASAADRVFVPRTGMVGSVGVVTSHMDMSKALERRGVAVTYVYAGARKIDRVPSMPLSPQAATDLQEKIDGMYELFVSSIARHTGLSADKIRATEAAVYMGQKGVDIGFAHEVGSFEQVLAMAIRQAGPFRLDAQRQENSMSDQKQGNGGPVLHTAEDLARARAEGVAEGKAAGMTEGVKEGTASAVKSERERIKAITMHPEAQGRAELAAELAFATDMSAEQATALLAKSPKAAAQSPLAQAMAREAGASVASQPGQTPAPTVPVINAANIFAARRQAAQPK